MGIQSSFLRKAPFLFSIIPPATAAFLHSLPLPNVYPQPFVMLSFNVRRSSLLFLFLLLVCATLITLFLFLQPNCPCFSQPHHCNLGAPISCNCASRLSLQINKSYANCSSWVCERNFYFTTYSLKVISSSHHLPNRKKKNVIFFVAERFLFICFVFSSFLFLIAEFDIGEGYI